MSDVLDPAALTDLLAMTGDDPEIVGEMVDTFLADSPGQVDAMRRAVHADSALDLMWPARTLRANALNLGAAQLAELCRQIEEFALRGSVHEAAARIAAVERAYADAVGALADARETEWTIE